MTPLEQAKQLLPLPDLLSRLGLADRAKKSALCPFHEDRNNSFSIFQNENGGWAWKCFAGCGGGDEIALIAHFDKLTNSAACKHYIQMAGAHGTVSNPPRFERPQTIQEKPKVLPPMPAHIADQWREGVDYILTHPLMADHLARFRGWPKAFAEYLIGCAAVSMPLYKNERGIAFQVVMPIGERGSMTTLPVGYHLRIKTPPGKKAPWIFKPNTGEDGQSISCLPFILGDFESARLLIIVEGQWDLLAFALAAGWLGDGCEWPLGVGMIGVRGAEGHGKFLEYYRPYWPENVNCLVLADADAAGTKWTTGKNCFADQLAALCARVVVADCAPHKDFNDLYRVQQPQPTDIYEYLLSRGLSIEGEVAA